MSKKDNESFVRWQSLTIEELGKQINLLLTFSVAVLGYELNMLTYKDFDLGFDGGFFSTHYLLSILSMLFSAGAGLFASFNRLTDFRLTTRLVKLRRKGNDKSKIVELRGKLKRIGKRTWKIFAFQISSFSIGIVIFSSFLLFKNFDMLFHTFCPK